MLTVGQSRQTEIMEKLAFTKTPQPIMARCFIQKDKKLVDGKRYLILDYLQDPGNIGTLIRTALAFGIDQVILSNECVDLYNDKLLRSMQGAHFHLSCLYGDLKEIIPALKEKGVCVVGSALENGRPIHEIKKQEKNLKKTIPDAHQSRAEHRQKQSVFLVDLQKNKSPDGIEKDKLAIAQHRFQQR